VLLENTLRSEFTSHRPNSLDFVFLRKRISIQGLGRVNKFSEIHPNLMDLAGLGFYNPTEFPRFNRQNSDLAGSEFCHSVEYLNAGPMRWKTTIYSSHKHQFYPTRDQFPHKAILLSRPFQDRGISTPWDNWRNSTSSTFQDTIILYSLSLSLGGGASGSGPIPESTTKQNKLKRNAKKDHRSGYLTFSKYKH
jgi:hypothetical protein